MNSPQPLVGVIMGSKSDLETLESAIELLRALGVPHEVRILSVHRTPDRALEYAAQAESRGLRAIIAAAGGAAHLPGMVATKTLVPVLGVPVAITALNGVDALLSIVQMPKGVPVGAMAIGAAGAANAALLAVAMLAAAGDTELREKLIAWRAARRDEVLAQGLDDLLERESAAESGTKSGTESGTKKVGA
ncbi:MAG TPA: 5-(carboxyamino)imidazole ribonucleotide mutase [Myxococcales bacterium]|nr:5-(carboxyamino)imidazole ribonucleotide mutase [Myxococcales bacterium]